MAHLTLVEDSERIDLKDTESNISLTDVEILPLAKETKEKLSLLNESYTRKLDTLMEQIEQSSQDYNETVASQEQYTHLKSIIGRIQLGSYNAHLLIALGEYLRNLEKRRGKLYHEARRLSQENSVLRQSIQSMQNDIYREEAELTVAQEEVQHWMFMNNIAKADAVDAIDNTTLDAWLSTIFPEIKYKVSNEGDRPATKETTPEFSEVQSMMMENLLLGDLQNAEKAIREQIMKHKVNSDTEAQVLIWLAKRCADRSQYEKSIDLMTQAMELLIQVYGEHDDSVSKIHNFLALVRWRNNQPIDAAVHACMSLCNYEKKHNVDDYNIAIQSLRVGYLFVKLDHITDGVKAMEFSMRTFEMLLPHEETDWLMAATTLIRTCNNIGAHVNALTLCCEVIDYFYMSRFKDKSPEMLPIYEIAAWHQINDKTQSEKPADPVAINLPEAMVGVIRELIIIFIQFYFFVGANVLDAWFDECIIIPSDVTLRLDRTDSKRFLRKESEKKELQQTAVPINYGKREGWICKVFEGVEAKYMDAINKCDVLETWSEASFQKTRKKVHLKLLSKASEFVKKEKRTT